MKTATGKIICLLIFNALLFVKIFSQDNKILTYLPAACEIEGWDIKEPTSVYAGEELFTLIDGGADIYMEYGFLQAASACYSNHHNNSIKIEIYEMSDASAAYGMFSLNAGNNENKLQIGSECRMYDYYLIFWKNRFLIYITGTDTSDATKSALIAMASIIDSRLGLPGEKPVISGYLPDIGLLSSSYFRGSIGLSSFYTFDTKNIFKMTEGVVGIYPGHRIFIFKYKSDIESKERYAEACGSLKNGSRYSDFKDDGTYITMADKKGSRLCITYNGNLILAVLCQSEKEALARCGELTNSIRSR
ncbi:MAG: hypothetical protein JXA06_01185 [Bacteroidetes bacterium]|nr:hypothetical protein [Bacteroidota bacterium]